MICPPPAGVGSLLDKLTHPLLETRLRTTKNLIFKCKNGLTTEITGNLSLNKRMFEKISQSLDISRKEFADEDHSPLVKRKVEMQMEQLMDLVTQFCSAGNDALTNNSYACIAVALNSLVACENIGKALGNRVFQVQGYLHSRRDEVEIEDKSSNYLSVVMPPGKFGIGKGESAADFLNQCFTPYANNNSATCGPSLARPGCILFTELVLLGWRFPLFMFTETDEKYLFDVEVKVKMGHHMAGKMVFDVLSDFPANAVLQRVGLLETMLNVLSSTPVPGSEHHFSQLDVEQSLRWLHALVKSCTRLFSQLLDGSLASRVPQQYCIQSQNRSLASQMSYSLYALRDPLHGDLRDDSSADWSTSSPSLSGMAFASVAAALPLLCRNDIGMNAYVIDLINEALPFICDPIVMKSDEDRVQDCNALRLQHILDRLDQIFCQFEPDMRLFRKEQDVLMRGGATIDKEPHMFALSLSLYSVLAHILVAIARDHDTQILGPTAATPNVNYDFPLGLRLGDNLRAAIKDMYSLSISKDLLPPNLLQSILEKVDIDFLRCAALRAEAQSNCRLLLCSSCEWGEVEFSNGGGEKIFDLLSGMFMCMIESHDFSTRIEITPMIGARGSFKVVNVLVAALLVAVGVIESQNEELSHLIYKFDNFLHDILCHCCEHEELTRALSSSIALLLDISSAHSIDEEEINVAQEHFLCAALDISREPLTNHDSQLGLVRSSTIVRSLLQHLATLSFVSLFLVNIICPDVMKSKVSVESMVALRIFHSILGEFHLSCEGVDENAIKVPTNERDLVEVVFFHVHLLVWHIYDDSANVSPLRSSLELFLSKLMMMMLDGISFHKVFAAGLYSSNENVRRQSFQKLCSIDNAVGLFNISPHVKSWEREEEYSYCGSELLTSIKVSSNDIGIRCAAQPALSRCSHACHATLQNLLGILFGSDSDRTIKISAVKQITATLVKDPSFLSSISKTALIDILNNLNEIILSNCDSIFCKGNDRDEETQCFALHCMLLMRCVLFAVPILLNDICICPQHNFVTANDMPAGVDVSFILRFALLSLTPEWGGGRDHAGDIFSSFILCCHDILRVWALRPDDLVKCKFRYARTAASRELSELPRVELPSYAVEFCEVNSGLFPAHIREKYVLPLLSETSTFYLTHDAVSKDNLFHMSTRLPRLCGNQSCEISVRFDLLREFADVISVKMRMSKNNASFNESIELMQSGLCSASHFSHYIMTNLNFVSLSLNILKGIPNTKQDYFTLNQMLRLLKRAIFEYDFQHSKDLLCEASDVKNLIVGIVYAMGGLLRHLFRTTNYSPTFLEICQHSALLLLTEVVSAVTECARRASTRQGPDMASELSLLIPILVEAFLSGAVHMHVNIQNSSSLCLRACARYYTICGSTCTRTSYEELLSSTESYNSSRSPFEELILIVKKIRTPSSMCESTVVISALRIVIVILKLDSSGHLAQKCSECLGLECLIRYTRDRRAIVRHMAIELIQLLYSKKHCMSKHEGALLPNEEVFAGCGTGQVSNMANCLRLLAEDQSEASAIRCLAIRTLYDSATEPGDDVIRFVLSILSEMLSSGDRQPSVEVVIICTRVLHSILRAADVKSASMSELLSKLKIAPKLVAVLQPGYLVALLQDVKSRTYYQTQQLKCSNVDSIIFGGWKQSEMKYLDGQAGCLRAMQSLCFAILIELCSYDHQIFLPCLKNTNIMRNVLYVLTDTSHTKLFDMSNHHNFRGQIKLFVGMSHAVSSSADLLSLMFMRDHMRYFKNGEENESYGCVRDLVCDPVVVCASIATCMTKIFTFVATLEEDGAALDGLILSLLRLLMLLLNSPTWRAGFGFGVADEQSSCPPSMHLEQGEDLFAALLALQKSHVIHLRASLVSATFTALSCMLQVSHTLRESIQAEVASVVKSFGENFLRSINSRRAGTDETGRRKKSSALMVMTHAFDVILKAMPTTQGSTAASSRKRWAIEPGIKAIRRDHCSAHPRSDSSFEPNSELWSAMLFFVGAFKTTKNPQHFGADGLLCTFVGLLSSHSAQCQSSKLNRTYQEKHHLIEVLALSAIASIASGSSVCKHDCMSAKSSCASARVALLGWKENDGVDSSSSMLPRRLLCMGLQRDLGLGSRLLALRLLENFMRDTSQGNATLRSALYDEIISTLHNDLKSSSQASIERLPSEAFSLLLDIIGSVLLPAEDGKLTERQTDIKKTGAWFQSMAPSASAALSISDLVGWTYKRYHSSGVITHSLIRFISRISGDNSFQKNNQLAMICRKTFVVVLSEEILEAISECCAPWHSAQVRTLAFITLWGILHRSERARAYFKGKNGYFHDSNFSQFSGTTLNNENNLMLQTAGKMVSCLIQNS